MNSDNIKKGSSDNRASVAWIYRKTKKYFPAVIGLSVLSAAVALSYVALALISKQVLDIAEKRGDNVLFYGILLLAVVAFQIVGLFVEGYLSALVSARITMSMRNSVFVGISKRRYSEITAYHSGEVINRMTSDVDVVTSSVVNIIPSVVSMFAKLIGGITALVVLDWRIAIVIVVIGFGVPFVGRIFNRRFKYLHKLSQQSEGNTRSFLQECVENLSVIKTFGSEVPFTKRLDALMHNNYKVKMKKTKISIFISHSLYAFFSIGYYLVLIWGATKISTATISYGTLMAFLQLVSQLRAPLQNVSGILPQFYTATASAERLMELENGEVDLTADAEKVAELRDNFDSIRFNNVCFAYKDEPVLKNCCFEVRAGEITALTGESGSGKSTVLKIIAGLYKQQSGDITVNGDIPLDTSLRGLFAYVPQGNMVLSGTVKENIALCDENVTEEELVKATKAACIYDVIKELPDGFDTVLTERGGGLSEGQIQRIAIARALLTDAPILLLDEATSDLDEQTEKQLLEGIREMKGKTVLFITHRNTSLKICDRILFMQDGNFTTVKE